jgi:pilus assembly protein CpaB
MNSKKVVPLAAALVLGLISARLAVKVLHNNQGGVQAASGPRLVNVVLADRDVAAGEQLDADAVAMSEIVADSAPKATFSDTNDVVGRVAIAPMVRGQAIVESLLAPKGSAAGLQAIIPPGMRAVTLDVNEVSGVAGYITPGCRVDILQTVRSEDPNSQLSSRCLVQNVQVTAVGVHQTAGQVATDGLPHSVTLLVTPRQAELIELASSSGRPRLVLRSERDNQMPDVRPVTLTDLTGGSAPRSVTPTPVAVRDPFATTRPTVEASEWPVRMITGGESSLVNLSIQPAVAPPSVTGNDVRSTNGP